MSLRQLTTSSFHLHTTRMRWSKQRHWRISDILEYNLLTRNWGLNRGLQDPKDPTGFSTANIRHSTTHQPYLQEEWLHLYEKKIVGFCSKNNNTFFLPSIPFTILFIFKGNSFIKTRFWSTVIIHWLLSSNRLSRLFPIIFLLVNFQYNQNCFVSFLVLSTTLFPIPFSLIFSITNCFVLYAALVTIPIALSL